MTTFSVTNRNIRSKIEDYIKDPSKFPPIGTWNVSGVTKMSNLFANLETFNEPIDSWDVSNVRDMSEMFLNAHAFNQPINSWDVSKVTNMSGMFRGENGWNNFNQPLDKWKVDNVTNMEYMFSGARLFNQPLNMWDVKNVTNMRGMFLHSSTFNQPLDSWDIQNVKDAREMFSGAQSFNQNLSNWIFGPATMMEDMFLDVKINPDFMARKITKNGYTGKRRRDANATASVSSPDARRILQVPKKQKPIDTEEAKFLNLMPRLDVPSIRDKPNLKDQLVPTVYSSYFFRKDIIKEFQNKVVNAIPSDQLPNSHFAIYNLYNKDDILNNMTYEKGEEGNLFKQKTIGYTNKSLNNMKIVLDYFSKEICSNIGSNYARTAVSNAIHLETNLEKFDILVISTPTIENVDETLENRLSGVVAFIIVELGECEKYPSAYSINLICTNLNKAKSGTGSILMGAFLYTILAHPMKTTPQTPITFPRGEGRLKVATSAGTTKTYCLFETDEPLIAVEHIAVLELAGAYVNFGGLCMYEKFGFTYDQSMYTNVDVNPPVFCFSDVGNLPMIIDFVNKPGYRELDNNSKKQKVANITAGIDRGFPKSKICSLRGEPQKLLGFLKTIKLYIDNTPNVPADVYSKLTSSQRAGIRPRPIIVEYVLNNGGNFENLINYLENPPITEDPAMKQMIDGLLDIITRNDLLDILYAINYNPHKLKKTEAEIYDFIKNINSPITSSKLNEIVIKYINYLLHRKTPKDTTIVENVNKLLVFYKGLNKTGGKWNTRKKYKKNKHNKTRRL